MTDESKDAVDDPETEAAAPIRGSAKRFAIREFVDADQLRKDMSYSLADLSTAMMEQSSLFAHYGVLASKASRQVDDVKMLLEATESAVYRAVRDRNVGRKITEAQIDALVAAHSRVTDVKRSLNEAKQIEAIAKTAVEAFRHRRDMLVQHGLISREELRGDISISRRNAANDERDALERRALERLNKSTTEDR